MCNAQPLPRCHNHLTIEHDKALNQFRDLAQEMSKANVLEKINATQSRINFLRMEMAATQTGRKRLANGRNPINNEELRPRHVEDWAELEKKGTYLRFMREMSGTGIKYHEEMLQGTNIPETMREEALANARNAAQRMIENYYTNPDKAVLRKAQNDYVDTIMKLNVMTDEAYRNAPRSGSLPAPHSYEKFAFNGDSNKGAAVISMLGKKYDVDFEYDPETGGVTFDIFYKSGKRRVRETDPTRTSLIAEALETDSQSEFRK